MAVPSAPQNLTIAFEGARAATEGLLKWSPPVNLGGLPFLSYEVAVAEGGSLGTEWVDTQSNRTRYLAKGLARGTEHTFAVRAKNADGVGPVSNLVTKRTPIASLHNTLFFKDCVNYFDRGARVSVHGNPTSLVRAVADNNYKTFTEEKDLNINIAVGNQPTRVDAIAVMGIDIEGHSAEPTGGTGSGYSNRQMPATVKNWEGTDVSTIVNGFQHDLYLLPSHFTATSVRMQFTGANAKIHEIMLLEFGLEIDANDDFTAIDPYFVDRSGVLHDTEGGGLSWGPTLGNERDKWEVSLVVKVIPGKTLLESPRTYLYWRSENKNHVFALEPSRHPADIYPAAFLQKRVQVRYRTDNKNDGQVMNIKIGER